MPNTDQTTPTTPVPSDNQTPAADEFDLGMLAPSAESSETPATTEEPATPVMEETPAATSNDNALDFSIDLPDSYSDTKPAEASEEKSVEAPVASVAEESNTSEVNNSSIPDITLPEAPVTTENTESSIPEVDLPDVAPAVTETSEPVVAESPATDVQPSVETPVENELTVDAVSIGEAVDQQETSNPGGGMFSSTQPSDETFVPDVQENNQSSENLENIENPSAVLFSEAPADINLNNQASPDISFDSPSSFGSEPKEGESLSDTLKFQEEVELSTENNNPLMEDTATPTETPVEAPAASNPLLEEPAAEGNTEAPATLNMDNLIGEQAAANPLMEEAPVQGDVVLETPQENVQDNQAGPLNLDAMIDQNTPTENNAIQNTESVPAQEAAPAVAPSQENSAELDPFMAMKQTLEGKNIAGFPNGGTGDKPTLDLNAMPSQNAQNPMKSSPLAKLGGISLGGGASKKKLIPLLSVLGVVVAGALVYIRYPDLLTGLMGSPSTPTPVVQPTIEPDQMHGSADTTGDIASTGDVSTGDIAEISTGITEEEPVEEIEQTLAVVPVDENLIKEDNPDIQVIDLSVDDPVNKTPIESTTPTGEPTTPAGDSAGPSQPEVIPTDPSAVDPFASVEGLVGDLNNTDLIKQEVMQYQKKGTELKDQGAASGNRRAYAYGAKIEKQATDLLQRLEKGEKMNISDWTTQKATFDDYIKNADEK